MERFARLFCLFFTASYLTHSHAALLNLTQTPLSLATSIPPNVFLQLDDSGSMDWEMVLDAYWEACAYDLAYPSSGTSSTCGTLWTGDDGLYSYANGESMPFNYIFNNSNNIYNSYNPSGCDYPSFPINCIQACPSSGSYFDWRVYSSDFNTIYYNPSLTYNPWVYNCTSGTVCANASFSAARSYPVSNVSGYSTTKNLAANQYIVWIDDRGFSGTRPKRGTGVNATNTPNAMVDLWDAHITIVLNATNAQIYKVTYNPNTTSMNATTTLQATLSGSACYNVLGSTSLVKSIFSGALSYTSTGADGCMTLAQAQQNYANWYQYGRRRSMAARGSLAYIINQYPNFSYGLNTINDSFFIQVPPSGTTNYSSYNSDLVDQLMTFSWQPLGTPNRSALNRVGQYYKNALTGKTNPISYACQQNFTIFITDGYWNDPDPNGLPSFIGDVDGDGISKTFADVAYYYYINNLQPYYTPNQVPSTANDPATWLHNVTFVLGFGITGNLIAGSDGWPTPPLQVNSNWGNPFTNAPAKADDMWHAAFNSKGAYFGSQSPSAASTSLSDFLDVIVQRSVSIGTVAQNSTVLNTSSAVYQGIFNSANWSGDLFSIPIDLNGQLNPTPNWSASCKLTGGPCANPSGTNTPLIANNRVIITRNWTGANTGIPFRWPSNYSTYKVSGSLPQNMANFLSAAPYPANTTTGTQITANQNYGQALLNYLRGDRTNEAQNNGSYIFRQRASVLGDIMGSSPIYVPAPYRTYPDSLEPSPYSTFRNTYANRTPVVYVGANDGMLHGFNAATGVELFAYIPGIRQIYQNLKNLSSTTYAHNFFVDGSPTEADVYFNNTWHTILVGNLKNGGQGIYAVDITDPSAFSEGNASNLYLWEFTDQDDPDVGYVQGNITIAKVRTGTGQSEWAAIFGNGYNNSQADGYASTTGKAALYILMIERFNGTWTLNTNYYKMTVGTGTTTTPSGLAQPFAADINGDYVVDYIYAGDLQGNLWNFNITSTTASSWSSSALFRASFSTAGDQPITAGIVVGAHPNGIAYGTIVYFGTGQFLQPTDNSTTGQTTQAFYAIWDKLQGATVTKSTLVQQQILGDVTASTGNYRLVSSNPINWNTTPAPQNLGWYINLIENGASSNYGERVVSQPILRNANIIFSTLLPSPNPCSVGGTSWLMELNAASGGTPTQSPFDVNNDGNFSTADYLTVTNGSNTATSYVSGFQSSVGVIGMPAVFLSLDKEKEVKVLNGMQGISTLQENPGTGPLGRQNWRQIY